MQLVEEHPIQQRSGAGTGASGSWREQRPDSKPSRQAELSKIAFGADLILRHESSKTCNTARDQWQQPLIK